MSGKIKYSEASKESSAPRPKRYGSITRRIFFWMCLISLVPLLVTAIQGYHCARQAVVDRAETHLLSVSASRKTMFLNWLDERKADIRNLSVMFDIIGGATNPNSFAESMNPEYQIVLEKLRSDSPTFETIILFDQNWKPLLEIGDVNHADINSLQTEMKMEAERSEEKDVIMGESHLHKDGNIGNHAVYRVRDRKGQVDGIIFAYLNLSRSLNSLLSDRSGLGKTGKVYLLFPGIDQYIVHSGSGMQNVTIQRNSRLSDVFEHKAQSVLEYNDYRGVKVLGVSTVITEIGCNLVVEMDQEEAFGWVYILQKRAIITGILTLLVVVFIAFKSSNYLTLPMRNLVEITRKIASGHHSERVGLLGKTAEVQEVEEAFNKMLDELADKHQKMVKAGALAAVGEMSSSIVHEMRSPLSAIKINLQAFREKFENEPDYSILVEMSIKQFRRLEKMLTDLLNYAKPIQFKPSNLIIEDTIEEVIELVKEPKEKKNIELTVVDKLGEKSIIADPEQIRIALTNLLLNAIQVCPLNGKIKIHSDVNQNNPEKILVSIIDNGPGVPKHLKNNIFLPFVTTRKEGTGLGLANVKKIVDYHDGNVWAENGKHGGAIFTIELPIGGPRK